MALKLSKARRTELEAQAWALSQQGWSQARIAAQFQVEQGTVSRALLRVNKRVLEALDSEAKLQLLILIGQLEHVRDEALQAWERSKKPKRKATKSTKGMRVVGADGKPVEAEGSTTEIVEREGEPAYLQAFMNAVELARKLLVLDQRALPKTDDAGDEVTARDALAEAEAADAQYVPDPVTPETPTDG